MTARRACIEIALMMHFALTQRTIPKGVDDRLVTVKDPDVLMYTEEELRALQAEITDPNFRIFADRDAITVFNNDNFANPVGTLPNALPTGNAGTAPASNTVQPGQGYSSAAAGTFGRLTSTVGTTVGLGTNRQVQFAFRLNF